MTVSIKGFIGSNANAVRGRAVWSFIVCIMVVSLGCSPRPKPAPRRSIEPLKPSRIVVLGFYAAVSPGQAARMIRDPLSGGVFFSEPVPFRVVKLMNQMLLSRLVQRSSYEFIRPGEARGVIADLAQDDRVLADAALEVIGKIGRTLDAEAVVVGHIYRWRERQGGKYAVQSPASVAFDLHLVRVTDGKVIWSRRFDKEQKSLSENILDYRTFFGGKGKWMTARELASLGLNKMMITIPLARSAEVMPTDDSNPGN